uniref:Uncharacterized protein n=1 Tax=Amphilophus citrinellus TaxID=61819 RepID=A0A3Q0RIW6_AMPCI
LFCVFTFLLYLSLDENLLKLVLPAFRFHLITNAKMVKLLRKRVFPLPHTQEPNPVFEAYGYCNNPNHTEQAWEGHSPADYKLLSVHVMIRHGDRYPLYSIPKTKRPTIDCTLSSSRYKHISYTCSIFHKVFSASLLQVYKAKHISMPPAFTNICERMGCCKELAESMKTGYCK